MPHAVHKLKTARQVPSTPAVAPLATPSATPLSQEPGLGLAEPSLLRLIQIISPLFPVGNFAYSQGLEQAVERGWVNSPTTLHEWLRGLLHSSVARLDLPMLGFARGAWRNEDVLRVTQLAKLTLSLRGSRELMDEDRSLGRALARALHGLGLSQATDWVGHANASYPVLFALASSHWGIPLRAAALGYAYIWSETQVSAASRVMPLGQTACQNVLSQLLESIPAAVELGLGLEESDIGSLAPAHAIAAAWHETQYSRLFRS
jgi:urease accessory protein